MLLIAALSLYASYTANIVALLQSTATSINTPTDLMNSPLKLGIYDIVYNRYYFEVFVCFFVSLFLCFHLSLTKRPNVYTSRCVMSFFEISLIKTRREGNSTRRQSRERKVYGWVWRKEYAEWEKVCSRFMLKSVRDINWCRKPLRRMRNAVSTKLTISIFWIRFWSFNINLLIARLYVSGENTTYYQTVLQKRTCIN